MGTSQIGGCRRSLSEFLCFLGTPLTFLGRCPSMYPTITRGKLFHGSCRSIIYVTCFLIPTIKVVSMGRVPLIGEVAFSHLSQ